MNADRTITCPACKKPVSYATRQEGTVGTCPHCRETVWYSTLVQNKQPHSEESHGNRPAVIAGSNSLNRTNAVLLVAVLVLGITIWTDNKRLANEVRTLSEEVRSLRQEDTEAPRLGQTIPRTQVNAQRNAAELEAIVSEINAIERVLEAKLAQLGSRYEQQENERRSVSTSVATLVEDIEELELGMSDIQETLNALIESYEALQEGLPANR